MPKKPTLQTPPTTGVGNPSDSIPTTQPSQSLTGEPAQPLSASAAPERLQTSSHPGSLSSSDGARNTKPSGAFDTRLLASVAMLNSALRYLLNSKHIDIVFAEDGYTVIMPSESGWVYVTDVGFRITPP